MISPVTIWVNSPTSIEEPTVIHHLGDRLHWQTKQGLCFVEATRPILITVGPLRIELHPNQSAFLNEEVKIGSSTEYVRLLTEAPSQSTPEEQHTSVLVKDQLLTQLTIRLRVARLPFNVVEITHPVSGSPWLAELATQVKEQLHVHLWTTVPVVNREH